MPATSLTTAGPALPLTPEQEARLNAMPAATRDLVLIWLLTGDPILVAKAKKKLAPLRPREDPSFRRWRQTGWRGHLIDRKVLGRVQGAVLGRCDGRELSMSRLLAAVRAGDG
ncbi:MAG: hypothetical protein JOZ53_11220, partial [Planctomycetaceae bacterium]|nr:hypothetical protein [Planctomycetaceae bacterium]